MDLSRSQKLIESDPQSEPAVGRPPTRHGVAHRQGIREPAKAAVRILRSRSLLIFLDVIQFQTQFQKPCWIFLVDNLLAKGVPLLIFVLHMGGLFLRCAAICCLVQRGLETCTKLRAFAKPKQLRRAARACNAVVTALCSFASDSDRNSYRSRSFRRSSASAFCVLSASNRAAMYAAYQL